MSSNLKPDQMDRKKLREMALQRPSDGKDVTMTIRPFKASRDRVKLPFKKGQGISVSGWQFQIRSIQPNGTINLKPIGRIVKQKGDSQK